MNYDKDKTPYSIRVRDEQNKFTDKKAERVREISPSTGSEQEKTYYSDGSSTLHGVMGDLDTDEHGNPC